MRLTELEHIGQIKQEYMTLRSGGICRAGATSRVLCNFEAQDALERLTFWIGLADAQYLRKELTLPVAIQALLALHRLADHSISITPGDIERRRKHYSQAPMLEPKLGRPKKEA